MDVHVARSLIFRSIRRFDRQQNDFFLMEGIEAIISRSRLLAVCVTSSKMLLESYLMMQNCMIVNMCVLLEFNFQVLLDS